MRVKLIGCASSRNEVEWFGNLSDTDYEFLDYTYHANPVKLHCKLQEIINESQDYDLIILTYSRCSNSLIGLISPKVPLLFPKTHDCIGFLLGSNEKHLKFTKEKKGTYYFSQGWIDYGRTPYSEYLEYEQKYGEKKARQIIESLYGRYTKAIFIKTPGIQNIEYYRRKVKEIANFFGWQTEEVEGEAGLLTSLIKGNIGPDMVYVEPGQRINESHYNRIK
ncbi:MAG: DUF1638 domain-containing protein [Thermincolia bacterium]